VRGRSELDAGRLGRQRAVVDAFIAALRAGDIEGLVAVLDPDVVFRADRGATSPRARPPVVGAEAVAARVLAEGSPFAAFARPAVVNGGAGVIVGRPGSTPFAVVSFTVAGGRIAAIDLITDRAKLRRMD